MNEVDLLGIYLLVSYSIYSTLRWSHWKRKYQEYGVITCIEQINEMRPRDEALVKPDVFYRWMRETDESREEWNVKP